MKEHLLDITVAANGEVQLSPPMGDVVRLELESYEIRGVPMVGSVPADPHYYLQINGLSMPSRAYAHRVSTSSGVALPLYGEVSRDSYKTCRKVLARQSPSTINNMTVTLLRPTGELAIFTQLTLRMRVWSVDSNDKRSRETVQRMALFHEYMDEGGQLRPL